MVRTARMLTLAASLLLLGARQAAGQVVSYDYPPPAVSCYGPAAVYAPAPPAAYYAPAVSYYAPAVSYYAAPPAVSYYAPAVSYYAAPPAVSYYAPAVSYYVGPSAVTTTRYGLFGRPRASTTYYYP